MQLVEDQYRSNERVKGISVRRMSPTGPLTRLAVPQDGRVKQRRCRRWPQMTQMKTDCDRAVVPISSAAVSAKSAASAFHLIPVLGPDSALSGRERFRESTGHPE